MDWRERSLNCRAARSDARRKRKSVLFNNCEGEVNIGLQPWDGEDVRGQLRRLYDFGTALVGLDQRLSEEWLRQDLDPAGT